MNNPCKHGRHPDNCNTCDAELFRFLCRQDAEIPVWLGNAKYKATARPSFREAVIAAKKAVEEGK